MVAICAEKWYNIHRYGHRMRKGPQKCIIFCIFYVFIQ